MQPHVHTVSSETKRSQGESYRRLYCCRWSVFPRAEILILLSALLFFLIMTIQLTHCNNATQELHKMLGEILCINLRPHLHSISINLNFQAHLEHAFLFTFIHYHNTIGYKAEISHDASAVDINQTACKWTIKWSLSLSNKNQNDNLVKTYWTSGVVTNMSRALMETMSWVCI